MEQRSRFRVNFNRTGSSASLHPDAQPSHHASAQQQSSQPAQQPKAKKLGFFYGRKWLLVVIAILTLLVAGLVYFYVDTKNQLNAAKNPETAGNTEVEKITNQINKSLQLPTGETPTLATVNDVSKLKAQTFFKNSQNGDKVLIYSKAGRAVLYRPSTQKVIEYAPVNLNNNQ